MICGRRSASLWREIAVELDAMLASARLEMIDADHLAPVGAPRAIATAIRELSGTRVAA